MRSMTRKLYDEDAYRTTCGAHVCECEKIGEDEYRVVLDQTIMFPTEGGQTHDAGFINDIEVTDVQIKDQIIYHTLPQPVEVGSEVSVHIDWEHRFSNMQMHSGEHIFSGLVHSKFGYDNVGFHLSDNIATMDYNGPVSEEEISELEMAANRIIWENRQIKTWYPDADELASLDYRSKSGISGDVRMVEIEGVDLCACCAPHVNTTAEIGLIKIVSRENYKGGVRLSYLCGKRAFADYCVWHSNADKLSQLLNCSRQDILPTVERNKSALAESKFENGALWRKLIDVRIENDMAANGVMNVNDGNTAAMAESGSDSNAAEMVESGRDSRGAILSNFAIYFENFADSSLISYEVNKIKEFNKKCVFVFNGDDEKGYRFLMESDSCDMNACMKRFKDELGAKGGGRPNSVQGTIVAPKSDIMKIINEFAALRETSE